MRALLTTIALAVALLAAPAAHADKAETVAWNVPCRSTGITNYLAVKGDTVTVDPFGKHDTFRDYRCKINGFRIEKTQANTKRERIILRAFAEQNADSEYPTVYCRRKEGRAVMIDLQWFWNPRIKHMTDTEKNQWPAYVHRRYGKTNPDCRVILRYPACRHEDGSKQKPTCVWDARHMGNGHGRSHLAVSRKDKPDRIIRLSHRRAHRLAGLR